MAILSIHHVSLLVKDTAASVAFYRDQLGLSVYQDRPDLGYPGAWLEIGSQQIHLLQLPTTHVVDAGLHGGRDYHIAFHIDDIQWIKHKCELLGLPYTVSKSGRQALFTRDPDGNALEFIQRTV